MGKKYEITSMSSIENGHKIYRIRAVRDFDKVTAGTLGGWVQHEGNLSHEGTCWVGDNARVVGNACIKDDASVAACAYVGDRAVIKGNAFILDSCRIEGNVQIAGNSFVMGSAYVTGNAVLLDEATIRDNVWITENAIVRGTAVIHGWAHIGQNANIQQTKDVLTIGPLDNYNKSFTFYKGSNGHIYINDTKSTMTIENFERDILQELGSGKLYHLYQGAATLAKLQIGKEMELNEKI